MNIDVFVLARLGSSRLPKKHFKKIGNELKSQGVSEIASNWREKLEEWNKQ